MTISSDGSFLCYNVLLHVQPSPFLHFHSEPKHSVTTVTQDHWNRIKTTELRATKYKASMSDKMKWLSSNIRLEIIRGALIPRFGESFDRCWSPNQLQFVTDAISSSIINLILLGSNQKTVCLQIVFPIVFLLSSQILVEISLLVSSFSLGITGPSLSLSMQH